MGDLTKEQLCDIYWLNEIDIMGYTPELHKFHWEDMCTTFFAVGKLGAVIVEMIDHFMDGSGSPYSNSELTAAVLTQA